MKYETVEICVDDKTIAAGDPWAVMHPVWWTANIYDGPVEYERSLEQFSRNQRRVFAVLWYREEVQNGGHDQFYGNSTGIVWKDALDGFRSLCLSEFATIVEQSAQRLGGSPSLDRRKRKEQLALLTPDFDDLDTEFYDLKTKTDLDSRLVSLMQSKPSDFYFKGVIKRAVLPKMERSAP